MHLSVLKGETVSFSASFLLRMSDLFFSLIPNKFLCDNAEVPKQRTKSFIQAMLKKNNLQRVSSRLNVAYLFIY